MMPTPTFSTMKHVELQLLQLYKRFDLPFSIKFSRKTGYRLPARTTVHTPVQHSYTLYCLYIPYFTLGRYLENFYFSRIPIKNTLNTFNPKAISLVSLVALIACMDAMARDK